MNDLFSKHKIMRAVTCSEIRKNIQYKEFSIPEYRISLTIKILDFLLDKYILEVISIKDYWYYKGLAVFIEEKQYLIFNIKDFMNEKLFNNRLQFILLNKETIFDNKVNVKSLEFRRDSGYLPKITENFNGYGIFRLIDGDFYVGHCKNGWFVGRVRIYDRYYNLVDEIKDYDKFFDDFIDNGLNSVDIVS